MINKERFAMEDFSIEQVKEVKKQFIDIENYLKELYIDYTSVAVTSLLYDIEESLIELEEVLKIKYNQIKEGNK